MRTHCSAPTLATNDLGTPAAPPAPPSYPYFDALGFRLTSLLRVALALSGLLLAPEVPDLLLLAMALYVLHSAAAYALVLYRERLLRARRWHWLDVAWGLAAIAVSGGAESVYYLFFLYPIAVASLRNGTDEGVAVSLAAVAGWLLVGMVEGHGAPGMERSEVLLRAAALLVLGYAIALWAGFEAAQRRRLRLLGDLSRLPNPRFGPDRLVVAALERLRAFYRADLCMLVLAVEEGVRVHAAPPVDTAVPAPVGAKLLLLPHGAVVVANAALFLAWPRLRVSGVAAAALAAAHEAGRGLGRSLGAGSWITVPLPADAGLAGRLCILTRHGSFAAFDVHLLRQVLDRVVPLAETVRQIDRLATDAAATERRRISLDLHDSAIQPYLGLKLGLEAMRRKAAPDNALARDIDDLYRMTQDCITELRGYVRVLGGKTQRRAAGLVEGLRRQAERFGGFYGLKVDVNFLSEVHVNDRLTAELVQMVGESLSNVGRHTASRHVTINLSSDDDRLVAQIIDDGGGTAWKRFTPVSLTRRAQQLGGRVDVAPQASGGSIVSVTIPL